MPSYIIYCDESTGKGEFYSDFFGGALLDARDKSRIEAVLSASKGNCQGEMKWTKISEYNEADYRKFIDAIMDLTRDGLLKFRVMFTQNMNKPPHATSSQEKYSKLYYQFIKHSFGLAHCNPGKILKVDVSVYLDDVPVTPAQFEIFRDHLSALSRSSTLMGARVRIKRENVTDVDSAQHIILQAVDVVLGAMQFRLNEKYKAIPTGKRVRAKRTCAKERVYKHLNSRIREIYPRFNIGVSTSMRDGIQVAWTHPYRHWNFVANGSVVDASKTKSARKAAPPQPT